MSARDAMAAMLDELMGPKRNVELGEDTKVTFDDPDICPYYLAGFCPHDMFVNTKADLGACPLVHDDNLRRMYPTSPEFEKLGFERKLLRFLLELEEDNMRRIKKNKDKLSGMDDQGRKKNEEEKQKIEKEMEEYEEQLKQVILDAEEAGNRGNVTKCQELVEKSEELKYLKNQLAEKLEQLNAAPLHPMVPPMMEELQMKPMEVCEVCGSMLIVNDAANRVEEHLTGKMHTGYQRIRQAIDELKERLKKKDEAEAHIREERRKERRGGDGDRERRRSRSRDRDRKRRVRKLIMFVESWMPQIFSRKHRLLHLSVLFFMLPFWYSAYNEQFRMASYSVEKAMFMAWERAIVKPGAMFKRAVVGFNCNVDLIVNGVKVIESLNTSISDGKDHESLVNLNDLSSTFAHFFKRGAAAERYMSSEDDFNVLVREAESSSRAHHHIGGNAALMADRIAANFPRTEVYLVGPIGPRSQALLHPAVKRANSTRIVKDELHVILEYKQGEILGDWVAPSSSRFITSHDHFSGSMVVVEMFFKAITQFKPDLVIITGVHLLEFQSKEMRQEKVRMIKRNLLQVNPKLPIHLELGSLADSMFAADVLSKIIPYVDSLGINEQELTFLSHIANGPYMEEHPVQAGTVHVYKVVEMLHWLLKTYGKDPTNSKPAKTGYRLSRIHFHCLTFHIMVSTGTDWSNLAAGLAAGARISGRLSCNINANTLDSELLEIRTAASFVLDKTTMRAYQFEAHKQLPSKVSIVQNSARSIRKRPPISSNILDEGVTFADVHNVVLAPTTKLPYPEKELLKHIDKTSKDLLKDKNKMKYGGKKKSSGKIDFMHIPIEEHVVVLFPGQGAQFVGMGKKLIEIPAAKRVFEQASEVLGYDMYKLCQEGPDLKLQQTLYCQPAVVTCSVAAFEALKEIDPSVGENLTDTAGFSVGEYSALVAGEMLSFEDAIKVVKARAEAMHECGQLIKSGMLTVRVKAASKIERAMADARKKAIEKGELDVCEIANYLYCGVRVIGGSETCLRFLEQNQEKYFIQAMKRLHVSAAFHTKQMQPAVEKVMLALGKVDLQRATCNVYSNYTGHIFAAKKAEVRGALAKQVSAPVKWEQIQQLLYRKHQDELFPRFYEVGPGRQLGSMLLQTSKKAYKNYNHFFE
ncbi:unnamed protein product [Caenorhabditis bovis]|uniref:Malonyl-CoA:ACP transacylase (MAT) domain-containing protein n=1 Tax=Caenorhabditis bovis TaxID=2654633 RepID=A0A8S1EWB0_9PELO|nr:unnamed protein product [Caenorhabditis bovis]